MTAMQSGAASRTNPWAIGTSAIVNGGLAVILLLMRLSSAGPTMVPPPAGHHFTLSEVPLAIISKSIGGGGGGGGASELIDPIVGRNPPFERNPLMAPQVPLLDKPQLAINPAIYVQPDIKLPDDPALPNIGVHQSMNVRLISSGEGTHNGIGSGANGGDGPGKPTGHGPGFERGIGDSVYRLGVGGVSNPVAIVTPEAEFSDEARRAKYQGACLIAIIVDSHGNPQNPHVVRSLGMGLDEKALDAVRRYRFKPALKDGKPVPVTITVEVNFRLY